MNYDSVIIAYCSEGVRSKKAVQILGRMGYKNLYSLENKDSDSNEFNFRRS